MPTFKEADRPITVTTPLGDDVLLLRGFSGLEGISRVFAFDLDVMAKKNTKVAFEQLLGKPVTVNLKLPEGGTRFFNGICYRVSEGGQDTTFTFYTLNIVPQFWLLAHRAQSRIFQRQSVPDILKKVLAGLDVSFQIQGTFEQRDFCVQYRETDFNFASRLMEEEGIYYFFKHAAGSHTMVLANTPAGHPDVPGKTQLIYEEVAGGFRDEDRVLTWEKAQELRSSKYTLFDHCFELPHKHLEAEKLVQETVVVGTVTHKLKLTENAKLELFDFPGEYAQRFDGVDKGGGDQPAELQKIFQDNRRTVEIRMQQDALPGLSISGTGNCRQMVAGHKFTLTRHFDGNGQYVITGVRHQASGAGDFLSGKTGAFRYSNGFTCIPVALPFRPLRLTPRPVVQGTQSAVVVGPPGEEIFPDKFSRVKVQFHWDREGKNDPDSSCWLRVITPWAGKQWGMVHIPRVGQEVIVDFLEGDPDQPIIVGSVYNSEMMPPYDLPANKTKSGIKTRSTLGGGPANFNEIRFEDKKGNEQLFIHAEKNQDIEVENDETHSVGHDRKKTIDHDETTHVKHDRTETVDHDETITIGSDRTELVGGNEALTVAQTQTVKVGQSQSVTVATTRSVTVGASQDTTVGSSRTETIGASDMLTVGASRSETVGGSQSQMVGGSLTITTGGVATITSGGATMVTAGAAITITAGGVMSIQAGGAVLINAGGAVSLNASAITLASAVTMCAGILMAPMVVAGAVASPVYTPGLGNML